MIIRPAHPEDIPYLFPLIERICDFHKTLDNDRYNFLPNQGQRYEKWLNKLLLDSHHLCLVAETDSLGSETSFQLVAYLIATLESEIPIYDLKEYGYIHDLWVEESYRHQGIARQLVMRAIAHFQKSGVQQIRLNTVVKNDSAFKLYADCGFRPSTVEMLIQCN